MLLYSQGVGIVNSYKSADTSDGGCAALSGSANVNNRLFSCTELLNLNKATPAVVIAAQEIQYLPLGSLEEEYIIAKNAIKIAPLTEIRGKEPNIRTTQILAPGGS